MDQNYFSNDDLADLFKELQEGQKESEESAGGTPGREAVNQQEMPGGMPEGMSGTISEDMSGLGEISGAMTAEQVKNREMEASQRRYQEIMRKHMREENGKNEDDKEQERSR